MEGSSAVESQSFGNPSHCVFAIFSAWSSRSLWWSLFYLARKNETQHEEGTYPGLKGRFEQELSCMALPNSQKGQELKCGEAATYLATILLYEEVENKF